MRRLLTVPAIMLSLAPYGEANSQDARLSTSLYTRATLTDNVRLAPRGQEETDLFFEFIPSFRLSREGARLRLSFDYSPSLAVYPFTGTSSSITNNLSSFATARLLENFLFLDASAIVTQTYLSPLSPRQSSSANLIDNQTERATFNISPYIQGVLPGDFTYLVRNETYWTASQDPAVRDLIEDHAVARLDSRRQARLRIGFDYDYRYTKFESEPYYYQTIGRVRPGIQLRPNLVASGRFGYEKNNYAAERTGVVYGAGLQWSPTPRTNLTAFAEKRFFGTGYNLEFLHRTRLTSWRLFAFRDTRTYREQGLQLLPGFTEETLNQALLARLPDPFERQQAIERILASAGLPPVLRSPFTFLANQPYLVQQADASAALIGQRNTATLHLFWQKSEPIVTTGAIALVPDVFLGSNNLKQWGGGLVLSHAISGTTT